MDNNNIYDGSDFYNLDYTHDQLEKLLDKLNEGCLLTQEQYKKLIEEIGLDNISTFDLDYNKLNNLPPEVPVRVSYFINDKDYIVRSEVKEYLLETKSYVEDEIDRLTALWESLSVLDIELLLEDVATAQMRVDNFYNMMETYNGTLFSMSRTVESIDARTEDVINDLLEFESKQEANTSLLDLLHETVDRHIREIQNLVDFVTNEKAKLEDVIIKLNKLIELADYLDSDNVYFHNEVNAMKKEIPNMIIEAVKEEFERISVEDLDIEGIIRLSKDVKDLESKYETIYNNLSESLNDIQSQFDAVNKELSSLETLAQKAIDRCADMGLSVEIIQSRFNSYEDTFVAINKTFEEHNNAIKTNLSYIRNLDNKYNNINSRTEAIEEEIVGLKKFDAEHYILIKQIERNIENINNSINNLNKLTDNNAKQISNIVNVTIADITKSLDNINKLVQEKMPLIDNAMEKINIINDLVRSLQSNTNSLQANLRDLESTVAKNKTEQNSLWENTNKEMTSLKSNINSIETTILTIQTRLTEMENNIKNVNTKIPTKTSQLINDSDFISESFLTEQLNIKIPTKTSQLTNNSGFITESTLTEELNTRIPTKTSQLINDSNFVTKQFLLEQFDQLNLRIIELEKTVNELTSTVPCTGVALDKTSLNFTNLSSTSVIKATIYPANTTDIATWSSSNTKVAIISNSGVVTPTGEGTCVLTVSCGNHSASCTVTVKVVVPCTGVTLNKSSMSFKSLGMTDALSITLAPVNTTDSVTVRSSNTSVATVTSSGVVKSIGIGSCTIYVTCGNITSTCTVTVTVACTSMSLSKTSLSFTSEGATSALTATPTPSNTTDTIKWTSSNSSVATVSSSGLVTAVGDGTCYIRATCGNITASCTVNVNLKVNYAYLTLSTDSVTLGEGESTTITMSLTPSNTSIDVNNVLISSSKPNAVSFTTKRVNSTTMQVIITMIGSEAGAINFYLSETQNAACAVYLRY